MIASQPSKALPIAITSGEPAGIGMDIILDLAKQGYFATLAQAVIVLGCQQAMQQRLQMIYQADTFASAGIKIQVITVADIKYIATKASSKTSVDFYLIDTPTTEPVTAGTINIANAQMVLTQLETAHKLAIAGKVAGIVTAPLQKSALIDANLTLPDATLFSGHTEYFMQMSGIDGINKKVVMMLANSYLKVALVTTHLPLSQVSAAITEDAVEQTVQIVLDSLHTQFGIENPKLLVCGLNPHAGEGGHLGMEEMEIINPVLQRFIDAGHDVSLAMPADTLFTKRCLAGCDATIAMYHDQGLPVLKSHGFGDSVNVTLGLPYIRTSVDHGTALDLAGAKREKGREKGQASSDSLRQAIQMLVAMS